MSRIIAGVAGGRRLRVPPTGTRPTSDRVREAVFSALSARVELSRTRILDLYAGTGALGLEALSRGAESATFVENNPRAVDIIRHNIGAVGLPGATVRPMNVSALVAGPADHRYDIIFLDPPYDIDDEVLADVLDQLEKQDWVAEGGILVVERSRRSPATRWPRRWTVGKPRLYGDTRVEIATP